MEIEQDNKTQFERFKYFPPNPSYLSGLIDGDGCIFIRKVKGGFQSGISLTQSRTNVLQIIRHHFGGSITSSSNRNNKTSDVINSDGFIHKHNTRNQYNIIIRSNEYNILLDYIKDYIIIKKTQIDCLDKMYKLTNIQKCLMEKEELSNKCCEYNKTHKFDYMDLNKINNEYISGLFDAEGCFYISSKKYTKFYISITQKNNPILLEHILNKFGFGIVDSEKKFKIYKKEDCLKFIQIVKNNLIVKYNQANAFETFLQTESTFIKEKMYKICNEEKHKIEHFIDLNQNDKGKDSFFETLKLRAIKQQICKEIHLKHIYKEKSEKMTCEGNHNYGKTFTEETKQKMSNSIRDAKGSVSDETIIEVRKLINEKKNNIEIQNLLNLPRHTITRIKNGIIVCRYEKKEEKKIMTQEEINISKRKVTTQEILFIIDKITENWKPMKVLDFLFEERKKKLKENNLTVDIIKNIKRNISMNKIPIYKSEVDNETYSKYFNIISEYHNKNKIIQQCNNNE
jgi:hypothetical protein